LRTALATLWALRRERGERWHAPATWAAASFDQGAAHLRASDPGRVEDNVVFAYLRAFDPDTEAVAELERQYAHGGLGDVTLKRRLEDVLQQLIAPMRERRALFARELSFVRAVMREGTERADAVTRDTLQRVRGAFALR